MHQRLSTRLSLVTTLDSTFRGLSATDIRRGDIAGYSKRAYVRTSDETFVGQIQLMDIPKA
ncbi:MAG: hypothetical protein Ct9H90mP16_06560 [Candidatus Poseidoniales archaeon]|nr:MAG: hypothetical protein Ct9H90mP16_06560 [Candidatus Poseidoniales archaeon]